MKFSIILFLVILALLSFFLTYIIRSFAIKKNVIDVPNERSSHTIPTPRGGGLAIVLIWYLGITILFFKHQIDTKLYWALLSGIILAIVSLFDDIYSLSPKIRLVAQTITAVSALAFIGGFSNSILPFESKIISTVVNFIIVIAIIWFINLYNFLDGIDGYASMEAIFIATSIFLFTQQFILLILIAATIGFLYWNWPKAKIFMGDVGSTQLGFILIVLGIYYHNINQLNFTYWLMLSSLFWFDATITLFRRWKNGEKLSQAHRKHAYQRIVQAGYSHQKTNILAICINAFILLFSWLSIQYFNYKQVWLFFNVAFLLLIYFVVERKYSFQNTKS